MQDKNSSSQVSVAKFAKNTFFAVASNWFIRLIGLASVTIMARILTPQDFGLVNLALSVVLLTEVLTYVGVNNALVRHQNPQRADYDTAWTIRFIINVTMGLIVFVFAAPFAADFFQREELNLIIQILSLNFAFKAIQNIGIVNFERELTFNRDFYMRGSARVLSFVLVISIALYFRNYWALVIGSISRSAALALFSYVMHPYRPRFCLTLWQKYLGYSAWMLLSAVAQGFANHIERMSLGRIADNYLVGLYTTSQDVSRIFTMEIAAGINRVAMPSFAKIQNHQQEFVQKISTAFGAFALTAVPFSLGISASADSFVLVLLGHQWRDTVPLLSIVAIAAGLRAMCLPLASILLASGHQRLYALINLTFSVVFATAIIIVVSRGDAVAVAQAAVAVSLSYFLATLLITAFKFGVPLTKLLQAVGRPCVAGAVMFFAVVWLPVPEQWLAIFEFLARVTTGAVVYITLLLMIWFASGKPDGAEEKFLREVQSRVGRAK